MTPSDATFYIAVAFLLGNLSGLMLSLVIALFYACSIMKGTP